MDKEKGFFDEIVSREKTNFYQMNNSYQSAIEKIIISSFTDERIIIINIDHKIIGNYLKNKGKEKQSKNLKSLIITGRRK